MDFEAGGCVVVVWWLWHIERKTSVFILNLLPFALSLQKYKRYETHIIDNSNFDSTLLDNFYCRGAIVVA